MVLVSNRKIAAYLKDLAASRLCDFWLPERDLV